MNSTAALQAADAICGHGWRSAIAFSLLSTIAGAAVVANICAAGKNNEGTMLYLLALASTQLFCGLITVACVFVAMQTVEGAFDLKSRMPGTAFWCWCVGQLSALANVCICRSQARDTHFACWQANDGSYAFSQHEGVTKREEMAYRRASVDHIAAQKKFARPDCLATGLLRYHRCKRC